MIGKEDLNIGEFEMLNWLRKLEEAVIKAGPKELLRIAKLLSESTFEMREDDDRVNLFCGIAAGLKIAAVSMRANGYVFGDEEEWKEKKDVH